MPLDRVYGFWPLCPEQGIQFYANLSLTGSEPVLNMACFFNRFKKSCLNKSFLKNRSIVIANKTVQNWVKQGSVYFLFCRKQGHKIVGVVLHRACILGFLFVLNRARVWNPQRHTYTQPWVKYPRGIHDHIYIIVVGTLNDLNVIT